MRFYFQGFYWNHEQELRFPIHIFKGGSLSYYGKQGMGILQDEYIGHYNQNKSDIWVHWKVSGISHSSFNHIIHYYSNHLANHTF